MSLTSILVICGIWFLGICTGIFVLTLIKNKYTCDRCKKLKFLKKFYNIRMIGNINYYILTSRKNSFHARKFLNASRIKKDEYICNHCYALINTEGIISTKKKIKEYPINKTKVIT